MRWDVDPEKHERFPARIELTVLNEPGSLAQIAQVIADTDANISNIRMRRNVPDYSIMTIDVEVFDAKHLTRLIGELRTRPVVSAATRVIA